MDKRTRLSSPVDGVVFNLIPSSEGYAVKEGEKWPSGKTKYEILLLKLVCFDVKQWTFGKHKTHEQSVIVEW